MCVVACADICVVLMGACIVTKLFDVNKHLGLNPEG